MKTPQATPTRAEVLRWLREEDPARLAELWTRADAVRAAHVGPTVHLRGLIEISNFCERACCYCGLRIQRHDLARYRMSEGEILNSARKAARLAYGTVVLQAGEDPELTGEWIARVVRRIKTETPLAVTLSLGEREPADLARWRAAGADRYLLRFETSDAALFRRIHPPSPHRATQIDRVAMLRELRALGYETGSGIMIGIPGQTYESVADDLALFRALDLDMIGIGPYLPHPDTPLGREAAAAADLPPWQVPATEAMVYKAVALTRLMCPEANLPSTTALATLNRARGRELGLARGANVIMPNVTPPRYRALYEIYPAKACIQETPEACYGCLMARIRSIGRTVGTGPGGRRGRHPAHAPGLPAAVGV